jgi:hypothetical protein
MSELPTHLRLDIGDTKKLTSNKDNTIREGQFRHTSVEIEFLHQIFKSPHHPKPITRCHVALLTKFI